MNVTHLIVKSLGCCYFAITPPKKSAHLDIHLQAFLWEVFLVEKLPSDRYAVYLFIYVFIYAKLLLDNLLVI